jgi:hypothetical protein
MFLQLASCPTWRNNRVGAERIAKHIDHFLVSEALIESQFHLRKWVGSGGESDHFPIFLELTKGMKNPASPFKFNVEWLKEESFTELVKEHWIPFDPNSGTPTVVHFVSNLKKVKQATITWAHLKRVREEQDLKEVEEALNAIYESDGGGHSSPDSKDRLLQLEKKKKKETFRRQRGCLEIEKSCYLDGERR